VIITVSSRDLDGRVRVAELLPGPFRIDIVAITGELGTIADVSRTPDERL
jgi:hypothetical protein